MILIRKKRHSIQGRLSESSERMKEAATPSHRAFALRRNPRDFPALLANSINFANAAGLVDSSASLAAGVELVLQPGTGDAPGVCRGGDARSRSIPVPWSK